MHDLLPRAWGSVIWSKTALWEAREIRSCPLKLVEQYGELGQVGTVYTLLYIQELRACRICLHNVCIGRMPFTNIDNVLQ